MAAQFGLAKGLPKYSAKILHLVDVCRIDPDL